MIKSIGVVGHDLNMVNELVEAITARFINTDITIVGGERGEFTVYVDCGPLDEEWREPEQFDYRVVSTDWIHYADILYVALTVP